jgi:ribonucleoside-triphosphate reductase
MLIRKRNGTEVKFDSEKIANAITRANESLINKSDRLTKTKINDICKKITSIIKNKSTVSTVEEVQDLVESELIHVDKPALAKSYITYRYMHSINRPNGNTSLFDQVESLLNGQNQEVIADNANKSPTHHNVARDYIAGFVCKEIAKMKLPSDIMDAHREGLLHYHDLDYAPAMAEHNCDLLDINDMLQNGTLMGGTLIHKPHSLATAMTVTTQISMNAASSQYGGQTITLAHLAPFVDISRKRIRKELLEDLPDLPKDKLNEMVEKRLRKEVNGAVQTLQYQEITCACSNGQSPFITIFMYLDEVPAGRLRNDLALLIEETLKQRIQGIQAPDGSWVAPVFPKLIYVLDEDNIHPKSKYYYLTELARDCTMKRMVPDYVSAKVMKKLRGEVFSSMGCRSQLSVLYPKDKPECILEYGTKENGHEGQVLTVDRKWRDPNKAVFYGRFNLGVCTINLPDVALTALEECKIPRESIGNTNYLGNEKVIEKFNEILKDRLELCHRALRTRYERLRGTSSNVAPILWQGGALARLGSNETIDNLLVNGWATISLGYAGLFETVKAITGESHTSPEGADFAMYIMETLHDICDVWRESEPEHLGYSLYGTPEEFLTDKLAKSLQRRHGIIKGVTDKLYVTNSYHVPVFEEIDAFSKLSKEAPFQDLSSGGNISYIELPSMNKNPDALMSVIKHIYETNIYAEVNTKLDHCYKCGYDGEIELLSNDYGRHKLRCPNCGNEDARTMYVIRRLCGYIGRIDSKDNPINPNPSSSDGRLSEIHDRVCHL